VFVADRDSFEASGNSVVVKAGVRRFNSEQINALNKSCPAVSVTSVRDAADFVVVWDTTSWEQTSWSGHQNQFSVYAKNGDLIETGKAHRLSAAAKDICKVLLAR
jgi:formylmethanofuran dehydrogenase subunit B